MRHIPSISSPPKVYRRSSRFIPGVHELQELSFDPKPRRGNKETSTSQNSPSVADLTRIFKTPPTQHHARGSMQGGVPPGATQIQQLFVQIPVQVVPPATVQQQVLAMVSTECITPCNVFCIQQYAKES